MLSGTTVEHNFGMDRGGGIAVDAPPPARADTDLGDAQIVENFAGDRGAGLWVNGGMVTGDSAVLISLNEVDADNGGGGMYVESGSDVCGVPFNRVIGNRAGPAGLENNIAPMVVCP